MNEASELRRSLSVLDAGYSAPQAAIASSCGNRHEPSAATVNRTALCSEGKHVAFPCRAGGTLAPNGPRPPASTASSTTRSDDQRRAPPPGSLRLRAPHVPSTRRVAVIRNDLTHVDSGSSVGIQI